MKEKKLEIAVIGAGGIGGISAAHIERAGYDLFVVDVIPELIDKVKSKGLHVHGVVTEFISRLKIYKDISTIGKKFDVVFVATKANVLQKVISSINPYLKNDGVVVSLQNGICENELLNSFGPKRVIGCVVGWGATVHSPAELEMTSKGNFTVGTFNGIKANHFDEVVELLSTVVPVNQSENIYGHLYSKLIINSCVTTLGAICDLKLGEMLNIKKIRNLFIQIICEGVEVCKASGITLESYAGRMNLYKFLNRSNWLTNMRSHLLIRIIGFKYRRLKSSSLQSLKTGRKTEIDYLNGHIVQKAHELKVAVPLNEQLVKMIKEIESGGRPISPANFNDPFFNQFK